MSQNVANVNLNLNTGDAATRLQKLALSSANMQQSWGELPANVQLAHREMMRLTQVHTRLGYLRGEERRSVRLHAEYIGRHQEAVRMQAERLRTIVASHPARSAYAFHAGSGTLEEGIANEPGVAHLHRANIMLDRMDRQQQIMGTAGGFFGAHGPSGEFDMGGAVSHYGRRALFGTGANGAPNTPGQWAWQGIKNKAQGAWNTAKGVSTMLTMFEGWQMLTRSMDQFEQKSEAVQAMGSRMGGGFEEVTDRLDKMRRAYTYTLAQIRPGAMEMQKLTGEVLGPRAAAALAFAKGVMPESPSAVMSIYARMGMYGAPDQDLIERGLGASGMRNRPEGYLGMLSAAQSSLGGGFFDVPADLAARYSVFTANAFGDAYRGPRGEDFMGRMIGGSRNTGNDMLYSLKLAAVQGMPKFDLGAGVSAGGSTLRGMRKAINSGDPEVLSRFFGMAKQMGGGGELSRDWFEAMLPGLQPAEVDALYNAFDKAGGKIPSADAIRKMAPNLDEDRARTETTEWYRQQKLKTDTELDVYEQLGPSLVATAQDAKQAAIHLIEGLTGVTSMAQAASSVLNDLLVNPAGGNLTRGAVGVQVQQNFGWLGTLLGGSVWAGAEIGKYLKGSNTTGATPTPARAP